MTHEASWVLAHEAEDETHEAEAKTHKAEVKAKTRFFGLEAEFREFRLFKEELSNNAHICKSCRHLQIMQAFANLAYYDKIL